MGLTINELAMLVKDVLSDPDEGLASALAAVNSQSRASGKLHFKEDALPSFSYVIGERSGREEKHPIVTVRITERRPVDEIGEDVFENEHTVEIALYETLERVGRLNSALTESENLYSVVALYATAVEYLFNGSLPDVPFSSHGVVRTIIDDIFPEGDGLFLSAGVEVILTG